MKLNSIAAALACVALGSSMAQAATVGDNLDADGSSDVIFQMLNPTTNETFTWDLSFGASDLTSSDFYTNQNGPVGTIPDTVALQNVELNAFIAAAANPGTLKWRVLGVGLDNTEPRNFGATVTSRTVPFSNNPGSTFVVTDFNNLLVNTGNGGVDADNVFGTADDSTVFSTASNARWATLSETLAFSNQAKTGFGFIDFYWVHRANTGAINVAGSIDVDFIGSFGLSWDGATANLAYAVPVPAAAWLFGSALLGLAGVARRKPA